MKLSQTIPIAFHGGSYGTYLEWILTTLCSDIAIQRPFTQRGNSHGFVGNHLVKMQGWHEYVMADIAKLFVRFHPKTMSDESLSENLNTVLSKVDQMIYLYPDHQSQLLVINNWYHKIWKCWWKEHLINENDYNRVYKNWPIEPSTPLDKIPIWIRREYLSLYLMPAWYAQVEWYHPDHWHDEKCMLVTVSELLLEPGMMLQRIKDFCGLTFVKDINQVLPYHNEMIKLQQSLGQDQLCQQIVQATINNEDMVWPELPIPSQSWIQWQLRNLGFELQCHGLDIFPNNSVQLKKLLYKP